MLSPPLTLLARAPCISIAPALPSVPWTTMQHVQRSLTRQTYGRARPINSYSLSMCAQLAVIASTYCLLVRSLQFTTDGFRRWFDATLKQWENEYETRPG